MCNVNLRRLMKTENNDATKWTKWSLKDRQYVINN